MNIRGNVLLVEPKRQQTNCNTRSIRQDKVQNLENKNWEVENGKMEVKIHKLGKGAISFREMICSYNQSVASHHCYCGQAKPFYQII